MEREEEDAFKDVFDMDAASLTPEEEEDFVKHFGSASTTGAPSMLQAEDEHAVTLCKSTANTSITSIPQEGAIAHSIASDMAIRQEGNSYLTMAAVLRRQAQSSTSQNANHAHETCLMLAVDQVGLPMEQAGEDAFNDMAASLHPQTQDDGAQNMAVATQAANKDESNNKAVVSPPQPQRLGLRSQNASSGNVSAGEASSYGVLNILPPEVRLMIYKNVFEDLVIGAEKEDKNDIIKVNVNQNQVLNVFRKANKAEYRHHGLFGLSKTIERDARGVFYGSKIFDFEDTLRMQQYLKFFKRARPYMTRVVCNLHRYQPSTLDRHLHSLREAASSIRSMKLSMSYSAWYSDGDRVSVFESSIRNFLRAIQKKSGRSDDALLKIIEIKTRCYDQPGTEERVYGLSSDFKDLVLQV